MFAGRFLHIFIQDHPTGAELKKLSGFTKIIHLLSPPFPEFSHEVLRCNRHIVRHWFRAHRFGNRIHVRCSVNDSSYNAAIYLLFKFRSWVVTILFLGSKRYSINFSRGAFFKSSNLDFSEYSVGCSIHITSTSVYLPCNRHEHSFPSQLLFAVNESPLSEISKKSIHFPVAYFSITSDNSTITYIR